MTAATLTDDIVSREIVPARGRWSRRLETGQRLASSTSKASRRSTSCAIRPSCRSTASTCPTRSSSTARSISPRAARSIRTTPRCCSPWSRTPAASTIRWPAAAATRSIWCATTSRRPRAAAPISSPSWRPGRWAPSEIVPNINFFMRVPFKEDGHVVIADGVSKPGDYVELLAEHAGAGGAVELSART